MILTLIGMSGAGKTFWATRLAAHGFTYFHCDALLAGKLRTLTDQAGMSLPEIGRWMGLPYEAGFRQREALYLACEVDVLRDAIPYAARCAENRTDCVIDTGGSAIYADPELFQQLRSFSTIVYLAVPPSLHKQMLLTYLDNPLPLIWNGLFKPENDESTQDTFARCYPQLIKHREHLYELYNDVSFEYSYHRHPALTTDRLLRDIQTEPRTKNREPRTEKRET